MTITRILGFIVGTVLCGIGIEIGRVVVEKGGKKIKEKFDELKEELPKAPSA